MEKVLDLKKVEKELFAAYIKVVDKKLDKWLPEREVLKESHVVSLNAYEKTGSYFIASQCVYKVGCNIDLVNFSKSGPGKKIVMEYIPLWGESVEVIKNV